MEDLNKFDKNLYYKGFTDAIKKYQKSSKYKEYRNKYEKKYREDNKILWNFKSWKSMRKKQGRSVTLEDEINYMLKRIKKG